MKKATYEDLQSLIKIKDVQIDEYETRIKELEAPKRWVSDEEIEQMAFEKFGHNSSSESYKNWVIGAKGLRDKLSPHTGESEAVRLLEWMEKKLNKNEIKFFEGDNRKPWVVWHNDPHGKSCTAKEFYQEFKNQNK